MTGPIPWTAVRLYADDLSFEPDLRHVFVQVVMALDAAYLQHHHDKREAADRRRREEAEASRRAGLRQRR